jgi:site-specific recombinase XerD
MKVNFYLKSHRGETSLVLLKTWSIRSSSDRFVFCLGERVPVALWDPKLQRLKLTKGYRQAQWLNALLDKYQEVTLNYIRELQVKELRPPNAQELKSFLSNFRAQLEGKEVVEEHAFATVVEREIERIAGQNLYTGRSYRQWYNDLQAFATAAGIRLEWRAMTAAFFSNYHDHLTSNLGSKNSVAMRWRVMKKFLNIGAELGVYKGKDHRRRMYTTQMTAADKHYLSVDKLMLLYRLDLADQPRHEKVRDLFLLDAFAAGFRHADLADLSHTKVISMAERQVVKIHTKKTNTMVISPGSWYLDEFLEKYKDGMPAQYSNQHFNKLIGEVCRQAGLNEMVSIRKAGKDVQVLEWKLVTQYTARYSFATNLYLSGVDIKQISVLLGHTNVSTTERYIKAKQLDTVLAMANNPFFTDKPKSAGS